ncbi:MFS family permease [Paenibacillus intestini]|uniref:MFS transporter n=1 Tax=Paenibacillus cucumis (ex Kampfer et al. 2016) TaxID=1776858 RepID=A0ABS7KQG8_9BACL|nr:MFS transporter [Paenibacillus cucumis (ex Kampfer et al. 2016)]MBY0206385.1 MFS transporter [Paenibacillus cucumis (ex Kampfer et al. 2016)]MDP9700833.1 MFS family permease [Paenibacillus intestini]
MSLFKTYAGLSRDIYYLCLARTINSTGDFIFSLITLVLTLQMGMSVVSAGIFVSMAALISGPGVLLGGYLSDLIGKKTIIISGQILSALMIMSCSFWSGTMTIGYLLIAVMFFISITRPAYNALIIQLCPEEKERKSAFSLMYLGANLGIALGPLIAGFFIKDYVHIVFLSIGTVFLISTFIIWKKVFVGTSGQAKQTIAGESAQHTEQSQGEQRPHGKQQHQEEHPQPGQQQQQQQQQHKQGRSPSRQQQGSDSLPSPLFPMLLKNPLVVFFIVVSFLNYFIYMQYSFSLPLQMNQTFGEHGAAYYGSVMTINAISVILLTTLVLSATRKFTALNSIAAGALFYGIGFGALYLLGDWPQFAIVVVSTVLWTIGEILVQTNINLYIASRVPDSHQGRFNGLLLFVGCLGYTLSPYLTGLFIRSVDMKSVWIIILGISLFYAICMVLLWYIEKNATNNRGIESPDYSKSV